MKSVTLKLLNETDDPKSLGGAMVDFCGTNHKRLYSVHELWRFGGSYANRSCTVSKVFWFITKRRVVWNLDFSRYPWASCWPGIPGIPTEEEQDGR